MEIRTHRTDNKNMGRVLTLSRREGEVLQRVASGMSNCEIAAQLHLSTRTVENHRYHICRKLGLKGRGALKRWIKHNSTLMK